MKVFNKSESRWRGCLTLRTRQPALWQPSWHVWSSAHSDRTLLSLWPKPKIPWLPFTVSMTYIWPFSLRSCHSIACTDGHSNTLLQHTITTYHAADTSLPLFIVQVQNEVYFVCFLCSLIMLRCDNKQPKGWKVEAFHAFPFGGKKSHDKEGTSSGNMKQGQ